MNVLQTVSRFVSKNSPAILTGAAVAGVLITSIFAARGAIEAHKELEDAGFDQSPWKDTYTFREALPIVWKFYIPVAISGSLTIACILGAQSINVRRNAVLVSTVHLTEAAFQEYKEKVVETIGANKERKVKESILKDRLDATPPSSTNVYITGDGDQLCFDAFTGRYFKSDIEKLRQAQNAFNAKIIRSFYGSMNEFYTMIGLDPVISGEDVGWNTDVMLELTFASMLTEDGKPCLVMDFLDRPVGKFSDIH